MADFYKIVLPLSRPALATLALLTFLTNWNDFLWPIYVLFSPEQLTLPRGPVDPAERLHYRLPADHGGRGDRQRARADPLRDRQRYVIEGISRSGLKG